MTESARSPFAFAAMICGVAAIGFSAIFVTLADAPGTVTSFYRMGIGSAVLIIPFLYRWRVRHVSLPLRGVMMAILGGLCFGTDMALWTTGVMMSGPTTPTLLANTAPLWVGLGTWILFGEKQNSGFWIGLILALAGSSAVLGQDFMKSAHIGTGALLGLGAAVFYGAFYLFTQEGRRQIDTLSYLFLFTFSAALLLLVLNLMMKRPLLGYPPVSWLNFLACGLVVQVLGWWMVNYAQGHLPASLVSPTLLGQPLITGFLAAFLFQERLTWMHLFGGAGVLAGIFIIHHCHRKAGKAVSERKGEMNS